MDPGSTALGYETPTGLWFDTTSAMLIRGPVAGDVDCEPPVAAPYKESVPQLQLSLTYACNMNCSYCSFRSRMNEDGRPLNMPHATTLEAVDFFVREVLGNARHARIDFGLTGETFLRHKIHAALKEEIRSRVAGLPLRSISVGPNTTNGTLSEEIGIDAAMGPPQDISCDGPKDVHDPVRPFTDGRGSYDELVPLIKRVLQRHPDIGVTAVITARCVDIARIFLHLYHELGFRSLYLKPVNLPPSDPNGLNPRTVDLFCKGYSQLVDLFIAAPPGDKLSYLAALNEEDYFMRFFHRIANRTRNTYRCGAGKSGAYVDTDGNLFACAHFIGKTGFEIGNVRDGFDEAKRNQYRALTVDSREPCRSCWAKYVCGGGCYYQAVLANGAIDRPDEAKCTLIRHLTAEAIRLYEHLATSHADVLAALRIPVHLPADAVSMVEAQGYRPLSALSADEETTPTAVDLLSRQHLEGSLPVEGDRLMLEMVMQKGRFGLGLAARGAAVLENVEIWVIDLERQPVLMADLALLTPDTCGRRLRWDASGKVSITAPREGAYRSVPFVEPVWRPVEGGVCGSGAWSASFDLGALLNTDSETLGVNITCRLRDGRRARLLRAEPFALLNLARSGNIRLQTPIWRPPDVREAINASPFEGMISLTEWRGLQQNVC